MATCKDTPGTTHHAGCACWEERRDAELAEVRAAHARTRAELAAARERLGMATCFDAPRNVVIQRDGVRWYMDDPERGMTEHATADAAFAALAAARKETP